VDYVDWGLNLKADVAAMTIGKFSRGRIVACLLRKRSQTATLEYCAYRRAIKGTSPASNNDLDAMVE
jgi:hypothetical protein